MKYQQILLKPLICKNDNCRKLLGYEKMKSGILYFECPRCKEISVFRINYSKGQENIDTLSDTLSGEGGE